MTCLRARCGHGLWDHERLWYPRPEGDGGITEIGRCGAAGCECRQYHGKHVLMTVATLGGGEKTACRVCEHVA